MKKKGFTLIELIVVIAIIGVLAAILVPAMLGYVKKSKITTANTTAKSVYNAFNSSLTDMDSEDFAIKNFDRAYSIDGSAASWGAGMGLTVNSVDLGAKLQGKVTTYFSDISKVKECKIDLVKGACTAVAVMNGAYPGGYPVAITVDMYNNADNTGAVDSLATAYAKQNATHS